MIHKTDHVYQPPKVGTTRTIRRFAFLPIYIQGSWVWLQQYEVLQGFVEDSYILFVEGENRKFTVQKWINVSSRIPE